MFDKKWLILRGSFFFFKQRLKGDNMRQLVSVAKKQKEHSLDSCRCRCSTPPRWGVQYSYLSGFKMPFRSFKRLGVKHNKMCFYIPVMVCCWLTGLLFVVWSPNHEYYWDLSVLAWVKPANISSSTAQQTRLTPPPKKKSLSRLCVWETVSKHFSYQRLDEEPQRWLRVSLLFGKGKTTPWIIDRRSGAEDGSCLLHPPWTHPPLLLFFYWVNSTSSEPSGGLWWER